MPKKNKKKELRNDLTRLNHFALVDKFKDACIRYDIVDTSLEIKQLRNEILRRLKDGQNV